MNTPSVVVPPAASATVAVDPLSMRLRIEATCVMKSPTVLARAASSTPTPIETGSTDAAATVTSTPGNRPVNVFPDEVTTCSAAVPAHSRSCASLPTVTTAPPGAVVMSAAVPAAAAPRSPRRTRNAPASPVSSAVSSQPVGRAAVGVGAGPDDGGGDAGSGIRDGAGHILHRRGCGSDLHSLAGGVLEREHGRVVRPGGGCRGDDGVRAGHLVDHDVGGGGRGAGSRGDGDGGGGRGGRELREGRARRGLLRPVGEGLDRGVEGLQAAR
ncbi:hypothetical protein L2X98_23440 [Microbacterium elymi]|uniref:Uncharacterized protein n=1 Tax=Microbacterium elymi TaxID=2909587 RepID=A0ABY5NLK9_9MICO|nr:hypothetical protein [Microbacterium elymi]UUT36052.1 hypothetical protein L2X98_23440 [Microbacterium elymi]